MGAVFYVRREVTGIDSAAYPLALRAYHVSVLTSTQHAYARRCEWEVESSTDGNVRQRYEVASQSAYLSAARCGELPKDLPKGNP